MTKGITYTATDSKGTVHTRYSARHTTPRYACAVIREPGNANKLGVSYASRRDLAFKQRMKLMSYRYQSWATETAAAAGAEVGDRIYPNAEIVTVHFTVGKVK